MIWKHGPQTLEVLTLKLTQVRRSVSVLALSLDHSKATSCLLIRHCMDSNQVVLVGTIDYWMYSKVKASFHAVLNLIYGCGEMGRFTST